MPDLRSVDSRSGGSSLLRDICAACTERLLVTGVSVSVVVDGRNRMTVCASDPGTVRLEDLQFDLGEGPGIDAFALRRPVLVDDLATRGGPGMRWAAFTPAALAAGARAVFAYPLSLGQARMGILLAYRDRPGALDATQQTRAVRFADAAFYAVLDLLSGTTGRGESDGAALDRSGPFDRAAVLSRTLMRRAEVYQAAGMLMSQLDISIEEATLRLRGHAFAHGRPVIDVAHDIVWRELRLDDDRSSQPVGRQEPL